MPQIYRKEKQKSSLKHNGLKVGALFSPLAKGSLTVETALVLPWFLFAMVTVLFLFRGLQIQYIVGEALDGAVAQTALEKEIAPEEAENEIKYLFYKKIEESQCSTAMINLGMAGFSWSDSLVDERYLDMKVDYQIKLPGWLLQDSMWKVSKSSRCRRWKGVLGNGENGNSAEWVYITPEGSVYHKSRECTHLKLSIHAVSMEEAEKYRACEHCTKKTKKTAMVYITEEGECYHIKLNCSGLKRTIYMMRFDQVKGRSPCSRCGGK